MSSSRFSGIVHNASRADGRKVYLPLEEVRVHILILDVSARITVTQVYSNPEDVATSRAKYVFPVPASAAICAFEARKADGSVIVGECMDKDRAREIHEKAIKEGKFTGLLEVVTDDIFTISVGSIRAKETIETKLVYVMTLLNNDNADEIRFQLPKHVGDRYGQLPSALTDAAGTSSQTRIRITADIQTSGRLYNVVSPSHSANIKETKYFTHKGRDSRRRTTVTYKSKQYLDKDFLLIIHAEGLDSPRCFAEVARNTSVDESDTIAFHLTMVPKFNIPPLPSQEYLFLIDRSGSMDGDRIATAKRTLSMLLKLLPAHGTKFNILSFGSRVTRYYPRSMLYNQSTMSNAIGHVQNMAADYGGTEIRMALQDVFNYYDRSMPTALFVLTDGQAYDKDATVADVGAAVKAAPSAGPLRVFTLGIGNGVSSDMCEGIARAGNGVCLFATDAQSILGKCERLFQAGQMQFVKNVAVDWGVPSENLRSPSVNFATIHRQGTIQLRPPHALQQSPAIIHDLHAGTRISICAILSLENTIVPKEVQIQGQLSESGEAFEITVPVRLAQLKDAKPADPTLPPIHTLAAWKLIQDHDEGRAPLPVAVNNNNGAVTTEATLRKAAIIRLGETYHVASRYTSFVAVDGEGDDEWYGGVRQGRGQYFRRTSSGTRQSNAAVSNTDEAAPPPGSLVSRFGAVFSNFAGGLFATAPQRLQSLPGGWPDRRSRSTSPASVRRNDPYGDDNDGYDTDRTFSTLSSLEEHSVWSDWSESRPPSPPPMTVDDIRMFRSPSPVFRFQPAAQGSNNALSSSSSQTQEAPAPPLKKEVDDLIQLQLYDGSYQLDERLGQLVGTDALTDDARLDADPVLWATALAAAYLQKHAMGHKELWIKPLEYLRSRREEGVLAMAMKALGYE